MSIASATQLASGRKAERALGRPTERKAKRRQVAAEVTKPTMIGIIVDRMILRRWQKEALDRIAADYGFIIYNCTNPHSAKRRLRHSFYYLLNLWAIRNAMTAASAIPDNWPIVRTLDFEAVRDGAWESLPDDLLDRIREDGPKVLIKFGMGLLRVPSEERLPAPILSYHHGDPTQFRGRPAGFYELLSGEPVMGQIVQLLSNKLDSGAIAAAAETRVFSHSYRATLIEAFRHSPLLLGPAIENCLAGRIRAPAMLGRNYRLPSNGLVARFVAKLAARTLHHLGYGLFREKGWKVATARLHEGAGVESIKAAISKSADWARIGTPAGYSFLADPFFHPDGGLLAEGLNSRTGLGEIVHFAGGKGRVLSEGAGHFSYPSTVECEGRTFMVPEIADWSAPLAIPLEQGGAGAPLEIMIAGAGRLVDPTPYVHGGTIYLFASLLPESNSVLRLWTGDRLAGPFAEHPASPICISPKGARMGGTPFMIDGRLIRVGQRFTGQYGDGLSLFEIDRLDREGYSERPLTEIRFPDVRGPHTLNVRGNEIAFDFYDDVFSPLAGVRRVRQRMRLWRSRPRIGC